jgi:hypothetical protein
LAFSTVAVENFVGKHAPMGPNACPASIPDAVHAFEAIDAPSENQQLSEFDGFHHDALQRSRRVS